MSNENTISEDLHFAFISRNTPSRYRTVSLIAIIK